MLSVGSSSRKGAAGVAVMVMSVAARTLLALRVKVRSPSVGLAQVRVVPEAVQVVPAGVLAATKVASPFRV